MVMEKYHLIPVLVQTKEASRVVETVLFIHSCVAQAYSFFRCQSFILKGTRLAKGSLSCSVCAAPEFASAMKEFEWRNGWFDAISQREHASPPLPRL